MKAVHVIVQGRVQGVWFRVNTQKQAAQLGVAGWVRNTEDGHVEIHMQGAEDDVEKLIAWCHHGPSDAMVTKVDIDMAPYQDGLQGFQIKY